jgi:hypothetical protein
LVGCRDSVDGHLVTPATVSEVVNMGWTVKYVLKFDDDVEVSERRWDGERETGRQSEIQE